VNSLSAINRSPAFLPWIIFKDNDLSESSFFFNNLRSGAVICAEIRLHINSKQTEINALFMKEKYM
jgi:hypothetical protein